MKYSKLVKKSKQLRQKTFQKFIEKEEAHLGGSFSMIEALIAIFEILKKKKDKFILSKSHASFPFCILLREKGFSPKISTHLEIDEKNGIHCTTGSLGHGLPIATGMALANKLKKDDSKIYVMMSDGECQEGTTWESLLIASKHKLNNLVIFVDYNKIQALSKIKDVLPLDNLLQKFRSFNINTINVRNGHSFEEIISGFNKINSKTTNVIILNTIKGKGISKFENDPVWHARKLTSNDILIGKKDLF
jgi:transketolase